MRVCRRYDVDNVSLLFSHQRDILTFLIIVPFALLLFLVRRKVLVEILVVSLSLL